MPRLDVSVIVPVYRDWHALSECLDALQNQDFPTNRWEIVIVSNEDQPYDISHIAQAAVERLDIRLVHEPEGYSYAARNAGVRASRGRILAFTDADCRPSPDWIRKGLNAIDSVGRQVIGGRVRVERGHQSAAALYESIYGLRQDLALQRYGGFVTANLWVERSVFDRGLMFEQSVRSGGDLIFCRAAADLDYKLVYAHDVVVRHRARSSFSELFRKVRRTSSGLVDQALLEGQHKPRLPGWFVRSRLRPPVKSWWSICTGRDSDVAHLSSGERCQVCVVRVLLFVYESYAMVKARLIVKRRKQDW